MNAPTDFERYRALYGPTAAEMVAQLADVPDALHARLSAFLANPTNDGGELLARDLDGARVAVMRVCQVLRLEVIE